MALLNCKECHNLVSDKAKKCSRCGAKVPISPLKKLLLIISIGFWSWIIYGCTHIPDTTTDIEKAERNIQKVIYEVAYTCGASVRETLNDPDSAKFDYDHVRATPKIQGEDATWIVMLPVRAKNGFNATIFALFACEVRSVSKNEWETIKMVRVE